MDDYRPYNTEINFIKIFNKILISLFAVVLLAIIILPINDVVSSGQGEIVSKMPQVDLKAAFDAVPIKVYVNEGDVVRPGDTLVVIASNAMEKDLNNIKSDYSFLFSNKESLNELIKNNLTRIELISNDIKIENEKFRIEKIKNLADLEAASRDCAILLEKSEIVANKLSVDSALNREGYVSKLQLKTTYDEFLQIKRTLNEALNKKKNIENNLLSLENGFQRNVNDLEKNKRSLTHELIKDQQLLVSTENDILQSKNNLNFYESEVRKQYIISNSEGIVGKIFNKKVSTSTIQKDDVLVSLYPVNNTYYAKIKVNEKDLWRVQTGQKTNLKLSAYYFYEHGTLEGRVVYIPDRIPDPLDSYIYVEIIDNGKDFVLRSGYAVKGEIIVEELKLWKYIYNSIFRKIQNMSEPNSKSNEN